MSDEASDKPPSARPPTPVRESVARTAPAEPVAPSRELDDDEGCAWRVEVAGRGRTGRAGDGGALLLLLRFVRVGAADDPDEDTALEALVAGPSLDDLTDATLRSALAVARVGSSEPKDFFVATRPQGPRRK